MSFLNPFRVPISRIEREIEEEFEFHISERTAQLEADGLDTADAQRRARASFGDLDRYKAEAALMMGSKVLRRRAWLVAGVCSTLACVVSTAISLGTSEHFRHTTENKLHGRIARLEEDLAPFRGQGDTPLAQQLRFVTVRGNVARPRVWTLTRDIDITLREIIAKCGGLTPSASGQITLVRTINGKDDIQTLTKEEWAADTTPNTWLETFCVVEVK